MASRKADSPIDLAKPHALTAGLITALRCLDGKEQAVLRDAGAKGLRVPRHMSSALAPGLSFPACRNGTNRRPAGGTAQV